MPNNKKLSQQKREEKLAKARPYINSLNKEIFKKTRKAEIVLQRGNAVVELKKKYHLSYFQIGKIFNLDHSSVIYLYRKFTGEKPKKYIFGRTKPKPKSKPKQNFNNHLFNRQSEYRIVGDREFIPANGIMLVEIRNTGKNYEEYQKEAKLRYKEKQIIYYKKQLAKLK